MMTVMERQRFNQYKCPSWPKPSPSPRDSATTFQIQNPEAQKLQQRQEVEMGSRLGRRVVHFANLPIKLLMPTTFNNIREIALKTIPSASKIEIKRVLQSLYGFDVDEVRTLNMEGKKKKRGGLLIAKPDYKKAYVTLRTPLSIPENVFPINVIQEEKQSINKNAKTKSLVEEGEKKKHWLDGIGKDNERENAGRIRRGPRRGPGSDSARCSGEIKFPWSSMKKSS